MRTDTIVRMTDTSGVLGRTVLAAVWYRPWSWTDRSHRPENFEPHDPPPRCDHFVFYMIPLLPPTEVLP
jgi:hypothetical protein